MAFSRDAYSLVEETYTRLSVYNLNLTGGDLLYLVLFGAIFFVFVFLVEYLRTNQGISSMLTK